MGDRAAERTVLGALHVDVDPLVVAGGVGERSTRSWVISSQSLVPSSSPTAAVSSSNVVNTRMSASSASAWRGVVAWTYAMPEPIAEQVRRAPKVLLHDHLDGGLRRRRSSSSPPRPGTRCPPTTPSRCGRWFTESADSGSLVRYLETFDHTVAVMQTAGPAAPGRPRVRRGPGRRRRRLRRGALRPRAAPAARGLDARPRSSTRSARASPRASRRPPHRAPDRGPPAAHRDAAPGPLAEIAELTRRLPRRRRGRLRHRRRRGRLPAHPAPRRVRVPPARERPLHHPRRRGVRAAVDLAGDPVVRRRPARPRRPDHRRHHRRTRTARRSSAGSPPTSATSGSRSRCARRPTCRPVPPRRSPSTRSGCSPSCASGSRSTPTTG